jgi:HSP20 family molecular chaperone IbpA
MAYILTPRFAPAYQAQQCNPFGLCAPVSRPSYGYRVARPRPQRPQYSSFNHFFSQVDELLGEIDRETQREAHLKAQREAQLEAQREAHRQRQQRKLALRAKFAVNQTEQGWQVDGDIQGFTQENINIEVKDEHTLTITGNTMHQAEKKEAEQQDEAAPAAEQQPTEHTSQDKMEAVAANEPDFENITDADIEGARAATPDSDTASHKSYQPTVEDDFEDLTAETSSLISSPSRPSSANEVKEPKGKEKAVEEPATTQTAVTQQAQPEVPVQQQEQEAQHEERIHGSFERTFRFPTRIDASRVSASFKDGALRITVPKVEVQQVRRIAIW